MYPVIDIVPPDFTQPDAQQQQQHHKHTFAGQIAYPEVLHSAQPPRLDLRSCGISDDNICTLVKHLQANPLFTTIELNDNQITSTGLTQLLAALDKDTLVGLGLAGNPIGAEGIMVLVSSFLHKNCTLQWIGLGGCAIGDLASIQILKSLSQNPNLTELYLWGNNLRSAALVHISLLVSHCTELKILDIGRNNFSDESSFAAFMDVLTSHSRLRELHLEETQLTVASVELLAGFLRTDQHMEKLVFWGNTLHNMVCARNFGEALSSNSTLKTFNMCTGQISEHEATCLVDALEKHTGIVEFMLPASVSQRLLDRTARFISRNKAIAALTPHGSDLSSSTSITMHFSEMLNWVERSEQQLQMQKAEFEQEVQRLNAEMRELKKRHSARRALAKAVEFLRETSRQ